MSNSAALAALLDSKAAQRAQAGQAEATEAELKVDVTLDLVLALRAEVAALTKKIEGQSVPLHPRDLKRK